MIGPCSESPWNGLFWTLKDLFTIWVSILVSFFHSSCLLPNNKMNDLMESNAFTILHKSRLRRNLSYREGLIFLMLEYSSGEKESKVSCNFFAADTANNVAHSSMTKTFSVQQIYFQTLWKFIGANWGLTKMGALFNHDWGLNSR